MVDIVNQKEYLKKYLAIGKAPGEKKKKKKKVIKGAQNRVTIIDDDVDSSFTDKITEKEPIIIDEDAPQIVAIIDERPPSLRVDEKTKNPLWQPIGSTSDQSTNAINREKSVVTGFKIRSSETSRKSPPRKKYSSDDSSLPRKSKSDISPPRIKVESSDDYSPPRRNRNDDMSPPRKSVNDDISPPRKSRSDDISPPRKHRKRDNSPPRKSRHGRSPHETNKWVNSPSRKVQREDKSPSKKSRWGDSSPVRKSSRKSKSHSPARKHKKSEDASPPRRNRNTEPVQNKGGKMEKTLDGKTAGLQNARQLVEETQEIRAREDKLFKNISKNISGENAQTVYRDRSTGRVRNFEEEEERRRKKQEDEEKNKEKYSRWGRGLAQVQSREDQIKEELHEMSKPLARYADDEDLEKYLKEQEREGDPMLAYIRSKKRKAASKAGVTEKPQFQGQFMPNRFGIRPGHRWDGVDRSNGYEKRWFEVQNAKRAQLEDSYKWSTEDM